MLKVEKFKVQVHFHQRNKPRTHKRGLTKLKNAKSSKTQENKTQRILNIELLLDVFGFRFLVCAAPLSTDKLAQTWRKDVTDIQSGERSINEAN